MRWTDPGAAHLTLAFLGEQPFDALERASRAARSLPPLEGPAALGSLGAFPDWKRPRVLWAGVSVGAPRLRDAAQTLRAALETEGFTLEKRDFNPHVTLGRVRSLRGLNELLARAEAWKPPQAWDGACFRMDGFTLMRSTLTPGRAMHEPIASFATAPRADA